MRIIVDHRERAGGVMEHLARQANTELQVATLAVGDYAVDGGLVFERKTLPDLAASLIEGRLFDQASRLAAWEGGGVYILEGVVADLDHVGVSREALQGALITLSVIYGLPVLRSKNPEETATLIRYTSDQVRRAVTTGFHRHGRRPKQKRRRQLYLLQGLPGVGPQLAARLLATFGSVRAVIAADAAALSAVEGIGPGKAAAILKTLV